MQQPDEKTILRARDFWGALCLIVGSLFFLWQTTGIPMWGDSNAGISGIAWYESAAIVPLGIFCAILGLSVRMLIISIRDGGARHALSFTGLGWCPSEIWRITTIAAILALYIGGLVPRVDFILCSGLLITALIYGYHTGDPRRMALAAGVVGIAGSYALLMHFPQAEWNEPHDDDWVTLASWLFLTGVVIANAKGSAVMRAIPLVAALIPFVLVCAMAFGFRQNVPNRGGLLFSQIEYHYYVTLRPVWSE